MDADGSLCFLLGSMNAGSVALIKQEGEWGDVTFLVFLFILFVIGGAYFGAAESGFSAMNKIRIKAKAENGDKRAKSAWYISNNFPKALTTLLIGINITHIASASIATVIATRLFGQSDKVTLLCTIVTTFIVFLFSEMIPKSFANDKSETTALFSAGSLVFFMKILTPLSAFFGWITAAVTKFISRFVKQKNTPSITEEELYDIIDTIEEEGVMDEEEGDLFKSALDFSQTHAKDVMTMREDICAIDLSTSNSAVLEYVKNCSHTRLPVYEGSIDNVIGVLQIRVFIREFLKNPNVDLRSLLLPAFDIRPSSMIDDLLSDMRQHKFYLGIVSENHKTLGLVTIEDFLEELVGEIWDEDDVVDHDFVKLGGNRTQVSTHLTIGELRQRLGFQNKLDTHTEKPLLSIILEHFGRIPEEEETFLYGNTEITIDTVEDNKVKTAVIRLLSEEEIQSLSDSDSEKNLIG